jgi:hypothetical protein
METQGILVIKSWGGGNKRGRYIESWFTLLDPFKRGL